MRRTRAGRGPSAWGTAVVMAALLAACGGSSTALPSHPGADVAYAGSLQLLNEKTIGPAFSKRTGFPYQGRGGGSIGLSKEIAAKELTPNVFESIGAAPIKSLEPRFTTWYIQLASSPVVVAYNPHSKFAPVLQRVARGQAPLSELFSTMAAPGFRLGRTNPATDPQGQAFAEMVSLATSQLHLPKDTPSKILGGVANSPQIFSETALDARLQAGQLDAASAFASQAIQLGLPYVPLPGGMNFGNPSLKALYAHASLALPGAKTVHGVPLVVDVTILGHKPTGAASAFVSYLLSPTARHAMQNAGYELLKPAAFGNTASIPKEIRSALARADSQRP